MKKRSVVFHKNYTRDTTLIIQQLWSLTMENGAEKLGIKSKFSPIVVDFFNRGSFEIWENDRSIKYLKQQMVALCKKQPDRVIELLAAYQKGLRELAPVWKRGIITNKKSLQSFISLVRELMVGDLFIVYIAEESQVPRKIKALASRLRQTDHFFVTNNQIFRRSLQHIFPKLHDYVNLLRIEELDKPPSLAECRRRFKNFISASDGYFQAQSLSEYARHQPFIFAEEKTRLANNSLKGRAANLGKVKGRARIVFSISELDKVKKGDILIAPMTTVDMMSAIKRAGAIVTDEGGIMCHAAIVARELRKPCLIATKAATLAFKDGDELEVDTYQGIVRKIS